MLVIWVHINYLYCMYFIYIYIYIYHIKKIISYNIFCVSTIQLLRYHKKKMEECVHMKWMPLLVLAVKVNRSITPERKKWQSPKSIKVFLLWSWTLCINFKWFVEGELKSNGKKPNDGKTDTQILVHLPLPCLSTDISASAPPMSKYRY